MQDLSGQVIFIAGGSTGLGKAIAKMLAAQGAHITLFSRSQAKLEEARREVLEARTSSKQEVLAVSLDLTDAAQVAITFKAQPRLPDALYCVAGGTSAEVGFFTDISTEEIEQCMRSNYLTSAYAAHALVKAWTQDDECQAAASSQTSKVETRHIVFVGSAAALASVPGYIAYAPTKCAQRALADTLRQELLMYCSPTRKYSVHCAFPSTFTTDSFFAEQKRKPELTKRIEDTTGPIEDLKSRYQTAEDIADCIIKGVEKDQFAICCDFTTGLLWTTMVGPSPKRGLGIYDSFFGVLGNLVIWPIVRRQFDAMCRQAGKESRQSMKISIGA